jgi:mono/diheme cytochrome c family protein
MTETNSLVLHKDVARAAVQPKTADTPTDKGQDATTEILASVNESSLTNGKSIYVQVCAACHGEDGGKEWKGQYLGAMQPEPA